MHQTTLIINQASSFTCQQDTHCSVAGHCSASLKQALISVQLINAPNEIMGLPFGTRIMRWKYVFEMEVLVCNIACWKCAAGT